LADLRMDDRHRGLIEEINTDGPSARAMKLLQQGFHAIRCTAQRDQRLLLRSGLEFEGHLRDDAQGAERADVELAQVVAGHILDASPSGLDLLSLIVDHADADDVIPKRAETKTPRPTDIGR